MNVLQGLTRFRAKTVRSESHLTSRNPEEQQFTSPQTIEPSDPYEQLQSTLFSKLPVEVRILIYEALVVGVGDIVHIATSDGPQGDKRKQICQPCIATPSDDVDLESCPNIWGDTHMRCKKSADLKMKTASQPRTFMPLLLSCKRIHAEAIGIIYSSVAFKLLHIDGAIKFLEVVPSPQLKIIRTFEVSWLLDSPIYPLGVHYTDEHPEYQIHIRKLSEQQAIVFEGIWRTIAAMKGLRELQITMVHEWRRDISERVLLEPLMVIQGIKNFKVELPWPIEMAIDPIENPPFEIRRQPALRERRYPEIYVNYGFRRRWRLGWFR